MKEKWLPVIGYEGIYEVSDQGRVRGLRRIDARGRNWPGKMHKPTLRSDGHLVVGLTKEGDCKTHLVHVLVLTSHVGPKPEGLECCHNDGNPLNNYASNLRWDTHSANMYDKVAHGRHYQRNKETCPANHPLEAPNLEKGRMERGHRVCLACGRARATMQRLRKKGQDGDFDAIAAEHLKRILSVTI